MKAVGKAVLCPGDAFGYGSDRYMCQVSILMRLSDLRMLQCTLELRGCS